MNKQDFIDSLRVALVGRLSAEQVQEHLRYYEDYINTQIRMEKREEDVLLTLGDPRLIAKTIVETSRAGMDEGADYQREEYRSGYVQSQKSGEVRTRRVLHIPGWLWIIIVVAIVALLLGLVFTLLSAFAPLICVMLVVVGLMKFFDWLN